MKKQKEISKILILVLVLFNIGCDQLSKHIVRDRIAYHERISIVDHHLTLLKVENSGAFLSAGDHLPFPLRFALLSLLPLLVMGYGLYFLLSRPGHQIGLVVGLSFVIGGGLGNLYDRLRFGSVTDFLHIDLGFFQTGIFNLADMSIVFGMLLIVFRRMLYKNPREHTV